MRQDDERELRHLLNDAKHTFGQLRMRPVLPDSLQAHTFLKLLEDVEQDSPETANPFPAEEKTAHMRLFSPAARPYLGWAAGLVLILGGFWLYNAAGLPDLTSGSAKFSKSVTSAAANTVFTKETTQMDAAAESGTERAAPEEALPDEAAMFDEAVVAEPAPSLEQILTESPAEDVRIVSEAPVSSLPVSDHESVSTDTKGSTEEAAMESGLMTPSYVGGGTPWDYVRQQGVTPLADLQAAREVQPWGAYIPDLSGTQLKFSEAMQLEDSLYLVLKTDEADVRVNLFITAFTESDAPRLVNTDQPAAFDLRLYDQPYGSSVPKEHQDSIFDPIFSAADVSQDVLASRMTPAANVPQTSFSVLYDGNTLMHVQAYGLTPAELLETVSP